MAVVNDMDHFASLGLQSESQRTSCGSEIFFYHRIVPGPHPILVLIHGYPQSAFMWRHVVSLLPPNIPLFVPDVPGYGRSTPSETGDDKRTIGNAILEALGFHLGHRNRTVVIGGHDRGARICHRLAVDVDDLPWKVIGTILLDIVPTTVQFSSFANSKNAASTFHWPFLANSELATKMILGYGGDNWCRENLLRWAGKNPDGLASLKANGAIELYSDYFKQESVIQASCEDYRAGSAEDVEEQTKDQAANKKLKIDTLISFSAEYLGARYDVGKVWEDWHNGPGELQVKAIDGGMGHFIAEEAPEMVALFINSFYVDLMFKK